GSRWQKASKAFLQSHPLCAECRKQGRYTKATVVDHIVPHRGDQKLFWDRSNWQPLCKACHDRKTWREDNRPTYTYSVFSRRKFLSHDMHLILGESSLILCDKAAFRLVPLDFVPPLRYNNLRNKEVKKQRIMNRTTGFG